MTDLSSLIERIEKSEGASIVLDRDIALTQYPDARPLPNNDARISIWDGNGRTQLTVKPYTASIDAAITLVPEGCAVDLTIWAGRNRARILPIYHDEAGDRWLHRGSDPHFCANAATPALALCACALKARNLP